MREEKLKFKPLQKQKQKFFKIGFLKNFVILTEKHLR